MRLVVDATVIVQLALSGGSLGPLDGHELLAPPLLASEVTSVLAELAYRSEIPEAHGRAAVRVADALPITYSRPDGLSERAWDIARTLGWAKTYDAEYIALAAISEAPLVTLDERLRRGAGHLVSMPSPADLGWRTPSRVLEASMGR